MVIPVHPVKMKKEQTHGYVRLCQNVKSNAENIKMGMSNTISLSNMANIYFKASAHSCSNMETGSWVT
jgi:hypothetical protein